MASSQRMGSPGSILRAAKTPRPFDSNERTIRRDSSGHGISTGASSNGSLASTSRRPARPPLAGGTVGVPDRTPHPTTPSTPGAAGRPRGCSGLNARAAASGLLVEAWKVFSRYAQVFKRATRAHRAIPTSYPRTRVYYFQDARFCKCGRYVSERIRP